MMSMVRRQVREVRQWCSSVITDQELTFHKMLTPQTQQSVARVKCWVQQG